jgi:AcrR family transcriptional regulator
MESSLRERQKAKRAEAILAAAGEEFRRRGLEAARIEDIAARAEVAPATVYNYFADKDGVLVALFARRLALQTERLIAAARAPIADVIEAVDHILDVTLDLEHPTLNAALFRAAYAASFARSGTKLAAFVAEDDQLVHAELVNLFRRLRRSGAVPLSVRPEDLADIVFAIGTFHWMRWVTGQVETLYALKPAMKRQCRLAIAGACGIA